MDRISNRLHLYKIIFCTNEILRNFSWIWISGVLYCAGTLPFSLTISLGNREILCCPSITYDDRSIINFKSIKTMMGRLLDEMISCCSFWKTTFWYALSISDPVYLSHKYCIKKVLALDVESITRIETDNFGKCGQWVISFEHVLINMAHCPQYIYNCKKSRIPAICFRIVWSLWNLAGAAAEALHFIPACLSQSAER